MKRIQCNLPYRSLQNWEKAILQCCILFPSWRCDFLFVSLHPKSSTTRFTNRKSAEGCALNPANLANNNFRVTEKDHST